MLNLKAYIIHEPAIALDAFEVLLVVNALYMDGDVVRRKADNGKLGRILDYFGGNPSSAWWDVAHWDKAKL